MNSREMETSLHHNFFLNISSFYMDRLIANYDLLPKSQEISRFARNAKHSDGDAQLQSFTINLIVHNEFIQFFFLQQWTI